MRRLTYLRVAIAVLGLAYLCAVPAEADPILFTFTGGAVGFLDGTPISNPAFRITLTGDTADVVLPDEFPGSFALRDLTATIDLGPTGVAAFAEPFYILSLNDSGFTSIYLGPMSQYLEDFYWSQDLPTGGEFYRLDASIGPFTSPHKAGNFSFDSVATSLGVLNVGQAGQATFQSTVSAVPEPSTMPLLGLGLIGLVARVRRSRATLTA